MARELMQLSCTEFASELAAKVSVPGGGGAAAYAGALSAALCSMVGNFTVGKPRYADVEEDVALLLEKACAQREKLLQLAQQDADAFEPLSAAYGIPKTDERRAEVLEDATKNALQAPFAMMGEICTVIDLLEEMGEKGSRMLLSDVACGAMLAGAALEMASVNVFVNTKGLIDAEYARTVEQECDRMLAVYVPRANKIAQEVLDSIR